MKKKIIYVILLMLFLFTAIWFFNHGYVEVSIKSSTGGDVTYTLINQTNQTTYEVRTSNSKIKKLVSKDDYEVRVKQGEESYFAVIKSGGFLSKVEVQANLAPEKNRMFIGNNPAPCMYYLYQKLVSSDCGAAISKARLHHPAKPNQATYTTVGNTALEGSIEGIQKTNEGTIALLRSPGIDEDQGSPHTAYLVGDNLKLTRGVALLSLNKDKNYSMVSYKDGFIVYDNAFEQILFFASRSATPVAIKVGKPTNDKLKPYTLSSVGDSIIVAYSNNTANEVASVDHPESKKISSEVVVLQNNQDRHFEFSGQPTVARTCGNNRLCLVSNNRLEVYDIGSKKPAKLFTVGGVISIADAKDGLLVVKEKEVLYLNIELRSGSIQYSLGDYKLCGNTIQNDTSGYTLCLVNAREKKVALRIDPTQANQGSIDKKVAELLKISEVEDVSAYGTFIFISPQLGEVTYQPSLKSFGYDPVKSKEINSRINQAINKIGIDRNAYNVINKFDH